MATEYYIVKPNKKQLFYLGKRISYLDGIPNRAYKEADYCTWETYTDVILDIQENSPYFLEGDLYIDQINNFCKVKYNTTFDRFQKIDVKGKNIEPLYLYLINNSNYLFNKDIKWNFTKFLIDRNGNIVKRFSSFSSGSTISKYIDKII